ncbi:unnamed protein product [Discula destructiva]
MASTRTAARGVPDSLETQHTSDSKAVHHHQPNPDSFTPPPTPFANRNMMAAAALDVLVVTFNCGKEAIDATIFARHLRSALSSGVEVRGHGELGNDGVVDPQRRHVLPDLVVFSLQEIAPLTYGYLGGQFLNNYFNPFAEALNMAALEISSDEQPSAARPALQRSKSTLSSIFRKQPNYPYKLIQSRNVGMTAIMLFARKPDAIHHIQAAECAFGIANMGNKGAIALRVNYSGDEGEGHGGGESSQSRTAEVTFVATHLAAMEYNLRRRNANWASICSSCLFEDPLKTVPKEYHILDQGTKNTVEASTHSSSIKDGKQTDGGEDIPPETEEEANALLERLLNDASMPENLTQHLHDISIFKRSSHLFVAGDLNYRISTTTPPAQVRFPNLETWPEFLPRDQLTQEKNARRTLHGLSEARISFPPTYKIKHLSPDKVADAVNKKEIETAAELGKEDEVTPWKWASHRWPGWCDRILYLDTPAWVQRQYNNTADGASSSKPVPRVEVVKYSSLPSMKTSDHAPVYLRALVPLLPPEELGAKPAEEDVNDPRARLPIPIDTGAFARRATARRREVFTGMTALFFSTKEGAIVVVACTLVGLWSYWLFRNQGLF